MIVDNLLEFAVAAALTTGTGTAEIDTLDMQIANDHGKLPGTKTLYVVILVTTAVTSGGSATVNFQLVSDAQDPVATDGTETLHASSGPIPVANLTAGARIVMAIPPESSVAPYERYLGLQSVVATAALTAGAVTAFISTTLPTGAFRFYPSADYGHA